jgi:hypothetical protein
LLKAEPLLPLFLAVLNWLFSPTIGLAQALFRVPPDGGGRRSALFWAQPTTNTNHGLTQQDAPARDPAQPWPGYRPDGSPVGGLNMSLALNNIAIGDEHDVVLARQRARQIAGLLGFPDLDQVRIATAVSGTAPASAWRWCGKWSNGWAGAWRMRRTMSS